MPYQREADAILTDWRAAKRDLEAAPDRSVESDTLRDEIGRLQDEYQRLVDEARARLEPEPPPFPTER